MEVRWLSTVQVACVKSSGRVIVRIFLQEAGHPKAIDFKDEIFLLISSDLADVFGHINALNVLLQRKNVNLIFCCEKVHAFMEKLSLWKGRVS